MYDLSKDILTSTTGQANLPRWFARVFAVAKDLRNGRLDFVLPDGRRFRAQGAHPGPQAELRIHDPDVFARLIREGDLGFCEAYLEGGWSSPDLMVFMDLIHADNDELYDGFPGMALLRRYEAFRHWLRGNSRAQARRNIASHYDLGNEFYALWLDPSMTYSSALYRNAATLQEAQRAKYAALIDALHVAPGDHVLEIGCGWGGFAEYAAAERDLRLTCLTISRAQHEFATRRIARAGLSDRVEIRLQDYRDTTGTFDAIASIEMFEAVGEKYWPTFFRTVQARLGHGARACIQAITVQERRFRMYRKSPDFIQKYIFPGGMLPPPSLMRSLPEDAGLRPVGALSFGPDYARTLHEWYRRFNARWPDIEAMGFDTRFRRMWNLYLSSCAGAFQRGNCDVTQFSYMRPQD